MGGRVRCERGAGRDADAPGDAARRARGGRLERGWWGVCAWGLARAPGV